MSSKRKRCPDTDWTSNHEPQLLHLILTVTVTDDSPWTVQDMQKETNLYAGISQAS